MKNIFYDLETTGFSSFSNAIHEIGLFDPVREELGRAEGLEGAGVLSVKVRPSYKKVIDARALAVSGVTLETILGYPVESEGAKQFAEYIAETEALSGEKVRLVGFNNRQFDDRFLREFLERNAYYDLAFRLPREAYDLLQALRSNHFRGVRPGNLSGVAAQLGISFEPGKLHGAAYDARLTGEIYKRLYGFYG